MKKLTYFIIVAAMVLLTRFAFAEGMKGGMMGKGMTGDKDKMKGMHGMMMKHAMNPSMAATSDGGVVVMAGGTLTKYDKNLNMVKEVKLDMKKACPMMGEKMGMGMMDDGEADKKAQTSAPAGEVDRASHH